MMPNEVAQLRTMAEMNRRLRRENEHLRESLLMESKESIGRMRTPLPAHKPSAFNT